ncbi:hypothetical protein GCM10011507_21060 [Edaphobacter acidisoli]|uniref:Peptidase M56 domain-containing protein n=1 Tax=Edaphobacter acidisoli TaxID=2040573 RepID=A0A916RTY4_9BACT|nr:M56 family metallopeptidase [Edaphobacter acidisoli]GGA69334.1 hypothetical protein GCM10011507_21060 [Edaphobacter acidisoli]
MVFAGFWREVWTVALVNHLWQSTLVALLAWLLTLALKNNHARARYWIWMVASVKFLVPFSAFVAIGESLRPVAAAPMQSTAFTVVAEKVAQPVQSLTIDFSDASVAAASHPAHSVAAILFVIWACGCLFVLLRWARSWWAVRLAVRASSPMALMADVPVRMSSELLEPGIFGIFRPVILLPKSIIDRLTTPQIESILAHEMCHLRRRDNLTIAIHMLVEAAFWFHPAVWWIEARLLEERERACDEAVLQAGNEAEVYAESILSVCKFYAEAPMACMSGVTGSDLKRRIVRIMTSPMARKLDLRRKLLLGVVALAAISAPVIFGSLHITQVNAQAAAPAVADQGLAGTWQGTLHPGHDLRIVIKVTKDASGYKATTYSIDQGGAPIPATAVTLDGSNVKISIVAINGSYEGKLSPDGNTITGTFTQGSPLPLVLTRATPETAWTIPAPPPKIPRMDANASPSFDVATIKPSRADEPGPAFLVRGRRFETRATTLTQLLIFAYGVNQKQLIGLPTWADNKFDIQGQPDAPGAPSSDQWKGMMQKLLAERFGLTFHREKRVMPVYVLSVASGGPKMTKNDTDPNGLGGMFFRQLGRLTVTNSSMDAFTSMILQGAVLDRPVLNQTGLNGKFNFTLNWTPDDSQFSGMGARVPPPTDGENALPNLYTALQEQVGLKLEATKAPAEVLVIDHITEPSAN